MIESGISMNLLQTAELQVYLEAYKWWLELASQSKTTDKSKAYSCSLAYRQRNAMFRLNLNAKIVLFNHFRRSINLLETRIAVDDILSYLGIARIL